MEKIIVYILIGIYFTSCSNQTTNNNDLSSDKNNIIEYVGLWESVKRPYPYKSHLRINADGSFQYESGVCVGHGFSYGKWRMKHDTIILTSDKIDSCLYSSHFGIDCKEISKDSTHSSIETTIKNCKAQGTDIYVNFNNEKFYLDGDTLRHLNKKQKLCNELRNIFFRVEENISTVKSND